MTGNAEPERVAQYKLAVGCHVCQKSDIAGVCHHCALPFCAEHLPATRHPWYRIDPEYHRLELPRTEAAQGAVHCRHHSHQRFNWRPVYQSAFLSTLGLLLPVFYHYQNDVRPTTLLVVWLALSFIIFVLAFAADNYEDLANKPPLPLFGQGPTLNLREHVRGTIRLFRDGHYASSMSRQYGRIDFKLAPDPNAQKRQEAWRRRYQLRRSDESQVHAGFLALQGKANITLQGAEAAKHEWRPHILAFAGLTKDHPFFPLEGEPQSYDFAPQYQFVLDGGLPVRLLPALVPTGDSLGLELTVQLQTKQPYLLEGADVVVQELTLCVPPELLPVRGRWPAATLPGEEGRCQDAHHAPAVVWQSVKLLPESETPVRASTSGYRRVFFVGFDPRARLWEATVSGSLHLRVENRLLSGLSGAHFYSPLGRRRTDLACSLHTEIRLNYSLSLHSLRLSQSYAQRRQKQYDGPATYEKVLALARRVSERGYYVKQLVEYSSGVLNRDDEREVERSWSLSGRTYRGAYPVNFEIEVSCPESIRQRTEREEVLLTIQAEARVSPGPSRQLLAATVAELDRICDALFGDGPRARPLAASAPGPNAGPPPGYDRPPRGPAEQPPGVWMSDVR